MMANDDDDNNHNNNSMPLNLDASPPKKRRNISGLDVETLRRVRPLVSIDYVVVKNMMSDDIDDRVKLHEPLLHGSLIVVDRWGVHIVHHHYTSMYRDYVHVGKQIKLSGPRGPLSADDTFIISVNFWVSWRNHLLDIEVTRDISRGEIVWDPNQSSYDQPLQQHVSGEYGAVTVGYSVIRRALSATVDVVWMNESKARISGTVKAVGSSTNRMLFERSANKWAPVLRPQESFFHNPGFACAAAFPFPVPVNSCLTIEVDLWDRFKSVKQIALGRVHFIPKFGTQKRSIFGKYGEVQVSMTCE